MFRDTFAVEMLLAGTPIDQTSLLLGHASVKISEKSYAPFVRARQLQLRESVVLMTSRSLYPGLQHRVSRIECINPPSRASLEQPPNRSAAKGTAYGRLICDCRQGYASAAAAH